MPNPVNPSISASKKITTPYFPPAFTYIAPLLAIVAVYLIYIGHPVWAAILIIFSLVMLTTHYATEINLAKKTYTDYLFFLGLKLNAESGKFTQVEKIVITKGDYATKVTSRVQDRTMRFNDYTGTLIFFRDHTLDLLSDIDKKRLLKKLKPFALFLRVSIEDRTTANPYWIDIDKY